MTLENWLQTAIGDAEARGLPGLAPLLRGLAQATATLRTARFIPPANGDTAPR
jgi:hypothetical protein